MSLPTYAEATKKPTAEDYLHLIAPYVRMEGMHAFCLAGKVANEIFMPLLWAEPTKLLFSSRNPYRKMRKFGQRLPEVRKEVRQLVLKLDFRPLQKSRSLLSELLSDQSCAILPCFNAIGTWYQCIGPLLPSLKFVILDRQNTAGRDRSSSNDESLQDEDAAFPDDFGLPNSNLAPFLLSAVGCSTTRRENIIQEPFSKHLLYLDISDTTYQNRNYIHFLKNQTLPFLKVLKLRNVNLTNAELESILDRFGRQLFSLDVRGNALTDPIIVHITKNLFVRPKPKLETVDGFQAICITPRFNSEEQTICYLEESSPPSYTAEHVRHDTDRYLPAEERQMILSDEEEELTKLCIDDWNDYKKTIQRGHEPAVRNFISRNGLTHLYLSNNRFSHLALLRLLSEPRWFKVIDFGSAEHYESASGGFRLSDTFRLLCQAGSIASLTSLCVPHLETLRIHHSIVTLLPTVVSLTPYYSIGEYPAKLAEEFVPRDTPAGGWEPDMLPRLHTLTLTSLPRRATRVLIRNLCVFLDKAALQEAAIARVTSSSRRAPKILLGLRVIRLEFVTSGTEERIYAGVSLSGDPDADEFHAQAKGDFSFFRDDAPRPDGKSDDDLNLLRSISEESTKILDVIAELRAYRSATEKSLKREMERLRGLVPKEDAWRVVVPPGPPHYHWGGRLEIVTSRS
ncbi:MAG: hypothetical protein M1818_007531 [Claussenomyces sp. TS43310]|nr:MAG: hypothetical protein M1818_007531 [Claussenomyces sp. TS43310]